MFISPESTILYVDDYAEGREAISRILRQAGFSVIEGETAGEALQLAATQRPHLILLDIGLPDLSGYDACATLKSDPATMSIPVLLLSGAFTEGEDRVRGLDSGADAYLCKPVESAELIATIRALLRMHKAEEEMARLLAREQAACRRAEDANRLKDEFLNMVSHELRAPLNSIQGWVSLLREGRLDSAETARALEIIDKSARTQTRIINDLLDVSRMITGRLLLNLRPHAPAASIESALESVRPAAEIKGISLEVDLDRTAGIIYGDAGHLQQVFWNLLSNAVKFTPNGGRVTVTLRRAADNIEIHVGDSGPGISPQFLPYVFDQFRQQDGSTTRPYNGMGLGLAIVRHLVEMHGGTVRAESGGQQPGATFVLTFPALGEAQFLTRTEAQTEAETEARRGTMAQQTLIEEESDATDCPPELDGLRILLVDEHDDARRRVKAILEKCGGEVIIADSAREAFEAMAWPPERRPEILICNIETPGVAMSGLDGYQLIRQLRARPAALGGAIPAVALTANARAEDRLPALAAGFQMHVVKPVDEHELVTVVASLTGRLKWKPRAGVRGPQFPLQPAGG